MRNVSEECEAVVAKCEVVFLEQIEQRYKISFKPIDRIFIAGEVRAAAICAFFDGIKYDKENNRA